MIDLLYIASPSFSGSTLLTLLLGAHPDIATIGELKWGNVDPQSYLCSCGNVLARCTFWTQVQVRMDRRGVPFDLARPETDFRCRGHALSDRVARAEIRGSSFERLRNLMIEMLPGCRERWPLIQRVNRSVIEIILEMKKARVFVDASKDALRLKYLILSGDYRVQVVHLIRDGRAVTCSSMTNEGVTADRGAIEWQRTHQRIQAVLGLLDPGQRLVVRYEDLCADPQSQLDRIVEFTRLPACDLVNEFSQTEQHVLGNRMRLEPRRGIQLDEKWRSRLTPSDLTIFCRVGGEMNRNYGYV